MGTDSGWLEAIEASVPDLAEVYRAYVAGDRVRLRRELRHRSGVGSAPRIGPQLDATAGALASVIAGMPDESFALPGGEADWTVSEAVGHDIDARDLLTAAAALAARGRWPADAPPVVPSVPGKAGATRAELLERLDKSRRRVGRAVEAVAGHESDECPLDHPQAGRMLCGQWLLWAGVHDLLHLEQLHAPASDAKAEAAAHAESQAGLSGGSKRESRTS
jgi:hypothetical protein